MTIGGLRIQRLLATLGTWTLFLCALVSCSYLFGAVLLRSNRNSGFSGRPLLTLPYSSQCLVRSGYTGWVSPGGFLDVFSDVSYVKADVGS